MSQLTESDIDSIINESKLSPIRSNEQPKVISAVGGDKLQYYGCFNPKQQLPCHHYICSHCLDQDEECTVCHPSLLEFSDSVISDNLTFNDIYTQLVYWWSNHFEMDNPYIVSSNINDLLSIYGLKDYTVMDDMLLLLSKRIHHIHPEQTVENINNQLQSFFSV